MEENKPQSRHKIYYWKNREAIRQKYKEAQASRTPEQIEKRRLYDAKLNSTKERKDYMRKYMKDYSKKYMDSCSPERIEEIKERKRQYYLTHKDRIREQLKARKARLHASKIIEDRIGL